MTIMGALFFGGIVTSSAYGQEADDTTELATDLNDSEDDAFTTTGQELAGVAQRSEKALKNEAQKDLEFLKALASTPTPPVTPSVNTTPTLNDSLSEIEGEVDSLEAQSRQLSQ